MKGEKHKSLYMNYIIQIQAFQKSTFSWLFTINFSPQGHYITPILNMLLDSF